MDKLTSKQSQHLRLQIVSYLWSPLATQHAADNFADPCWSGVKGDVVDRLGVPTDCDALYPTDSSSHSF